MNCRLSRAVRDVIVAHALAERPRECCGMLIGSCRPHVERAGAEILEAVPARNLADSPDRFFLDPKDHVDARRHARARGLEVVGFYHSHPHSPPRPSERDRREAAYPAHLYLIVSLEGPVPEVAGYWFEQGDFLETALVTVP